MHINPQRSSKIVAAGIAGAMLLGIVTACSIDYAGLSEGLNDLGMPWISVTEIHRQARRRPLRS